MHFRADTPASVRPVLLSAFIALCCTAARADEATPAIGPGLLFSKHYTGYFLQYYRDAKVARRRNEFVELTAGA